MRIVRLGTDAVQLLIGNKLRFHTDHGQAPPPTRPDMDPFDDETFVGVLEDPQEVLPIRPLRSVP